MPDIFLYSGEAAPQDIKLRDPTVAGAGGLDGNASGDTIVATVSPIGGTATGDAGAAGVIQTDAASVVSGVASGDASVSGVTLTATTASLSGAAAGDASAAGVVLAPAASLVSGLAAGDATADGVTLTGAASVVDGIAAGDSVALGTTLSVLTGVVSGEAVGEEAPIVVPLAASGAGSVHRTYRRGRAVYRRFKFLTEDELTAAEVRQVALELRQGARVNPLSHEIEESAAELARIVGFIALIDRLAASVADLSSAIDFAIQAKAAAEDRKRDDESAVALLLH